jgi:hypothetical protein
MKRKDGPSTPPGCPKRARTPIPPAESAHPPHNHADGPAAMTTATTLRVPEATPTATTVVPPEDTSKASRPKVKSFRIQNIPLDWTKEQLLDALRKAPTLLEFGLNDQITLHRSCYNATQVAVLSLSKYGGYFEKILSEGEGFIQDLKIDCDFYGMTQLNTPGEIRAE